MAQSKHPHHTRWIGKCKEKLDESKSKIQEGNVKSYSSLSSTGSMWHHLSSSEMEQPTSVLPATHIFSFLSWIYSYTTNFLCGHPTPPEVSNSTCFTFIASSKAYLGALYRRPITTPPPHTLTLSGLPHFSLKSCNSCVLYD